MLNIEENQNVSVIRLSGNLVMSNADHYRSQLTRYIQQDHSLLVVDLSQVTFVDSSGLAVLISAFKKAHKLGGNLFLLSPQNNVRTLIELTRLNQLFEIYEDEQVAIGDLNTRLVSQ